MSAVMTEAEFVPSPRPITSVLKQIGRDHELAQCLVLVIHRFTCFFQDLTKTFGGSADMFECSRTVLVGFFQGVECGGHAQASLTQPQRFSPPSVTLIRYWVMLPAGT